MSTYGPQSIAAGLLAFVLGPIAGLIFGKAGIIFGTLCVALYLAGRMGGDQSRLRDSAAAGMLTVLAPALAAGLPARWIAESLYYNRYITWSEQAAVSGLALVVFTALGAVAGLLGRPYRK